MYQAEPSRSRVGLWWGIVVFAALALAACADSSGGGSGTSGPNTSEGGSEGEGEGDGEDADSDLIQLETFQAASLVAGQHDFVSNASNQGGTVGADTLMSPVVATMYGGRIYVGDSSNDRVLAFNALPGANGADADFAIGQASLTSSAGGSTASAVNSPFAAHEDEDGRLFVVDRGNGRVVIFDSAPDASGASAQVVVGQDGFSQYAPTCDANSIASAEDLSVAGGKLLVADSSHHRVLIWNSIPETHGTAADLVLGQPSLDSCSQNQDGTPDADTLSQPTGVWSDGTRVVVADNNNHRLLIWTSFPAENGQPADIVLGQADFTSGLDLDPEADTFSFPQRVFSNGTQLFVADTNNNRVLIWDGFPTENGQPADKVLGQGDFTHGTLNDADQNGVSDPAPDVTTLKTPTGVFQSGNVLLVADHFNHRVLVFEGN